MSRSLNVKTEARIQAQVDIRWEPGYEGGIDRFAEKLDEHPEFARLAFSTILGAVCAAARKLGRYDAKNDRITRSPAWVAGRQLAAEILDRHISETRDAVVAHFEVACDEGDLAEVARHAGIELIHALTEGW